MDGSTQALACVERSWCIGLHNDARKADRGFGKEEDNRTHKEPREVYNVAIMSTSQDIRPSIIRVSAEYYLDTTRKVDMVNSLGLLATPGARLWLRGDLIEDHHKI